MDWLLSPAEEELWNSKMQRLGTFDFAQRHTRKGTLHLEEGFFDERWERKFRKKKSPG